MRSGVKALPRNKGHESTSRPRTRAAFRDGVYALVRNKRDRVFTHERNQQDTKEFSLLGPEIPPISAEGQVLVDEIDHLADDVLVDSPDETMLFVAPPTKRGAKRLKIAVHVLFAGAALICLLLMSMLLLNRFARNGVGGMRFFVEHTDAMRPEISRGALLITTYRSPANINKGDIITYYAIPGDRDTRLTRIVESVTEADGVYTYTTRRAATKEQLDSIRIDHTYVLGVKLFAIPLFGYVISFMYLYGWGFAVLAAAMLIAAIMLRRWLKDKSPGRGKSRRKDKPNRTSADMPLL